jgi:hypothetical protein
LGTAIIELNDSAIQCQHDETILTVPGYALLTRQGVVTGEEAVRSAWLLPQQSHNQYWHQLNLSPLTGANKHARHHADLAYAQLQALYVEAGRPEKIIFAIPGNMTNDQLSILLGLVKASPFNAAGLVDAAVAAVSHADFTEKASGDILHVDIQLHTSVITHIECNDRVSRKHATQYPNISLKGFYDTWARFIADRFIDQYRYDPMHTAEGEQQLRDLLPIWLDQLVGAEEIEIELSASQGNFRLNILRTEFIAANSQRWQRLADAISGILAKGSQTDSVLISHRIAALPGLDDYIEYAGRAVPEAAIKTCLAQTDLIVSDSKKLSFVTELPTLFRGNATPIARVAESTVTRGDPLPSHILHGHKAHTIGQGLSLTIDRDGLSIYPLNSQDNAPLPPLYPGQISIILEAEKVALGGDLDMLALRCSGDLNQLKIGDELIINGETLTFIEVM